MKEQCFPDGWDLHRVREVLAHYESQTEDEEFAEIEAALRQGEAMALTDPIAVYNAAHNFEAQLLRTFIIDAGIEAYVTEDISNVGAWIGGLIPEIHKPQVWVDRADAERVKPILDEFERRASERRDAADPPTTGTIVAECEECGRQSKFSAAQAGSVQDCPNCGAFIDVGAEPAGGETDPSAWGREPDEPDTET